MATTALTRWRALGPGALVSVLIHSVLVAALVRLPVPHVPDPPLERGIEVQIVPERRPAPPVEAGPGSPSPAEQPKPSAAAVSARGEPTPAGHDGAAPTPEPLGMVVPKRMLSTQTLADARSRGARSMLRRLTVDERVEQLCGIEAMAQIVARGKGFQPDRLVAYAMADTRMADHTLVADGAAFHSRGRWFSVKFRCGLTMDQNRVVSFRFAVGEAIPRSEWSAHDLPAEDGRTD